MVHLNPYSIHSDEPLEFRAQNSLIRDTFYRPGIRLTHALPRSMQLDKRVHDRKSLPTPNPYYAIRPPVMQLTEMLPRLIGLHSRVSWSFDFATVPGIHERRTDAGPIHRRQSEVAIKQHRHEARRCR